MKYLLHVRDMEDFVRVDIIRLTEAFKKWREGNRILRSKPIRH